jgi:hypothetical protein
MVPGRCFLGHLVTNTSQPEFISNTITLGLQGSHPFYSLWHFKTISASTRHRSTHGPQMFSGATNLTIHGGTFQLADTITNIKNPEILRRGMSVFSARAELEISVVEPGQDILLKHVALGAFHNSRERFNFDSPKCYPRTREAIIAKIEAWVKECPENGGRLVLWMYGPAGAGKSAIAQSIAELCEAFLAASFFFSRTASGRNDNSRFIATIVWQLIRAIPEISEIVLSALERERRERRFD